MPKKIPHKGKPEAHDELSGFDIRIDPFGALQSTIQVDRLNAFLNDKVVDKKLDQKALDSLRKLQSEEE
ncbi:MAG: hypothetical protein KTR24_15000 [Saprospiraceae bacterium]|nr:hypothetical protein [Saprospiraceae bacterium]